MNYKEITIEECILTYNKLKEYCIFDADRKEVLFELEE